MPRVSELPIPTEPNGTLYGGETLPVVQNGTTVQSKIYNIRYSSLSSGTNNYVLELLSYELNGYTSIAEIKFFQNGVQIPSTEIIDIQFSGTAPLSLTGSLANVIDGDPETYVRFQYDVNTWDTFISVSFSNTEYQPDEIRVTAPSALSGVNLEEAPSYGIIRVTDQYANKQFGYATYDNPNDDWEQPWTAGQEKIMYGPVMLSNPFVPSIEISSVNQPTKPQQYAMSNNCVNFVLEFPNVYLNLQDYSNGIFGTEDENGLEAQLGQSQLIAEVLSHRENVALITDASIIDNTLSQTSFYQFNGNYTANTLIFKNNSGADVTLTLVPSSQFTNDKYSPLHSKKTFINTDPTYNVTLDASAFTTVIGGSLLVVPPLTIIHFMEYEQNSLAVWS